MKFYVDDAATLEKSRIVGLNLALSGLRIIEEYRRVVSSDFDKVMIVLAVAAITAERLARAHDRAAYADLRIALPDDAVAPCNVSSVAAATGLPRETARRKITELMREGILQRTSRGVFALSEEAKQQPEVFAMLRRQAGEIARLATVFSEAGVIRPMRDQVLIPLDAEAA